MPRLPRMSTLAEMLRSPRVLLETAEIDKINDIAANASLEWEIAW